LIAARLQQAWLRRGPLAWLLWPVSLLMGALVGLRRLAFRRGWARSVRLPVPVIVVGNRIVGGAGKTPTTIALLQHLQAQGWRPGVLSRGYKAALATDGPALIDAQTAPSLTALQVGDEPLLIWRRCQVPLMIGRDRAASGQALLAAYPEINMLVCDDGLQHLRLRRDIEIVVFDERGAGNGWLLPAGPLREPIDAPPPPELRAKPIVIYNAPQASTGLPGHLSVRHTLPLCPLPDWWLGQAASQSLAPADTQAASTWALAGIAHPQRFQPPALASHRPRRDRHGKGRRQTGPGARARRATRLPRMGGGAGLASGAKFLAGAGSGTRRTAPTTEDLSQARCHAPASLVRLHTLPSLLFDPQDGHTTHRTAGMPCLQGPAATQAPGHLPDLPRRPPGLPHP